MIRVDAHEATEVAAWLGELSSVIGRHMPDGMKRAGDYVRDRARAETIEQDAIGATRAYLEGWLVEPLGERADSIAVEVFNTADHAEYVEFGVQPKSIPPETPEFVRWMQSKGLPPEASFPIRRAIHRLGAIRRAGAHGSRAGLNILDTAAEESAEPVFDLLDEAFDRALGAMS